MCIVGFLKQKKLTENSLNAWSFFLLLVLLFWSFYKRYKVMSIICYMIWSLFLLESFSQLATKITFTSETSVILLLYNCLPSNAMKNFFVKFVERKLEEAFFKGIRRDIKLGHFILLSVPISK